MNRTRNKGFTIIELAIVVAFLGFLGLILTPLVWYEGERKVIVQGQAHVVDCIGLLTDEPALPPGYRWDVEANPIIPSFLMLPPAGPVVVALTDAKCPVPTQAIPGVPAAPSTETKVRSGK